MRKTYAAIAIVFFAAIAFFTIMGGRIYQWTHLKVDTTQIQYRIIRYETNEDFVIVPRAALTSENCVYIAQTSSGYSFPLTTLEKRTIELSDYVSESFGEDYVCAISGLTPGTTVIVGDIDQLSDGQRVVLRE